MLFSANSCPNIGVKNEIGKLDSVGDFTIPKTLLVEFWNHAMCVELLSTLNCQLRGPVTEISALAVQIKTEVVVDEMYRYDDRD